MAGPTGGTSIAGARLGLALGLSAGLHLGAATLVTAPGAGAPHDPNQRSLHVHIAGDEAAPPVLAPVAAAARRAPAAAREAPADATSPDPVTDADRPGFGVPLAPLERYFVASELDRRPQALAPIQPVYPTSAPPEGGYMVLRLLINESGTVDRVVVLLSDPEGAFDEAAKAAFGAGRFLPGMKAGAAVKSQMLVELKFHPEERTPAPPLAGDLAAPAPPVRP